MPVVPTIETMSATTAEAVSMPPAPGPSSVISRIASPWSMTALNAPSTAASGWCAVDERRRDANVDRSSTSVARADQPHDHVHLRAPPPRAPSVTRSIPSNSTSSSVTREPNATVARIAIFAAASAPETSSVGSASA